MRSTRRWAALVVAAAAALVIPAGPSEARPQEVDVQKDRFAPAEVRVDVDETVRWVVREEQHTITSDDGLFDSGEAGPGSIYVARFHNPGRYAYYCSIYGGPGGKGMSGVVIVREQRGAAATTTTTAPTPAPTTTTSPPTTTPPPPPAAPPVPVSPAAAPPSTTATTKARPATTTTAPAATTTTAPPPPESTTTTAPPAPPAAAPPPDRYPSGPVPEVPDPAGDRALYRIDRDATQRRLASATRDPGDERGNDALVVVGGGLLVVAGLFLVVPGWRTRRT